jgi:tetratricopeptide (TPR) repeat protein
MMKPLFIFLFLSTSIVGFAQDFKKILNEGIALHDQGKYKLAIQKYESAAKIEKKAAIVYYEMAYSYYALKDYDNSIKKSKKAIKLAKSNENNSILLSSYLIHGAAIDDSGDTKKAIKIYNKAIKKFPNNYLLRYNLGYSYFKNRQYDDAQVMIEKALTINPKHGTSHILLAHITRNKGLRVQSIMAMNHFLYLENLNHPVNITARSKEVFSILKKQTIGNVTRDGENSITINLSLIDNDEFSTTNMLLSLMEASNRILADSLNLSENQRIHFFMKTFCSSLADKTSNGAKFWTGKYLTIFQQLHEKELVETFTNILLLSSGDPKVATWLNEHEVEVSKVEGLFLEE